MGAPVSTPVWRRALITGASAGIGVAVARRLAADGVPELIVVARRVERLDDLAEELRVAHGTAVEVVAADLAVPGDLERVAAVAADGDRPLDVLVNNAGLGTPGRFVEAEPAGIERMLAVNVDALVTLTRAVLPGMVERHRGAICNVSSLASYQPTPGSAAYAASKAFVTSLGESLYEELRGTGVTVTTVCPGFTRTEFLEASSGDDPDDVAPGFVWMSAEAVADAAVDATRAGRALCIPGTGYKVVAGLTTPLPRSAKRWLMGRLSGSGARLAGRD